MICSSLNLDRLIRPHSFFKAGLYPYLEEIQRLRPEQVNTKGS